MIVYFFVFSMLNYYTFAYSAPDWFCGLSYLAQIFCLLMAIGKWEGVKEDIEVLRKEIRQLKARKNK